MSRLNIKEELEEHRQDNDNEQKQMDALVDQCISASLEKHVSRNKIFSLLKENNDHARKVQEYVDKHGDENYLPDLPPIQAKLNQAFQSYQGI